MTANKPDRRKRHRIAAWAIAGPHGLYNGWRATRKHMIETHVGNGGLTIEQNQRWLNCQARGDRAVKIIIAWYPPG